MKISEYVKPEIDYILSASNFTNDEEELFLLRTKDITMEECAERMNLSIATIYRISNRIKAKINRIT